MAQKVVDYNAIAPNFSSVKDQIDKYGGGGGSSEEIKDLRAVFCSEEYDPTKTYSSGDYVWYDGKLYMYGSPFPITGDFDPTKWILKEDQIEAMSERISNISSRVDNVKYALAGDFSEGTSYPKGQFCWYNGVLYAFRSAHEGEWTGEDVIRVRDTGDAGTGVLNMIKLASYEDYWD